MRIFLISDTHFDHDNIVKYENRPENFNEIIIENWNKLINKDDLIMHLGDFCLSGTNRWEYYIKNLNGRKILIRGNHDSKSFLRLLGLGFDFVCDGFIWGIYGKIILFTHEPVLELPSWIDLNIHGHQHSKGEYIDDKHKLFAIENTNYCPILLSKFIEK